MTDIEIIKEQLKKIKELRDNSNPIVVEQIKDIKSKYLIKEDMEDSPRSLDRYDVPDSVESEIEDDEVQENGEMDNNYKQSYRVSGGVININGDDKKQTDLTTEDKRIFQETMDEFVSEVSDLVNFNPLNVYSNNVDWSGVVVDFDTEFYFTIGESNGIYVSNEMTQVDENYLDFINKLQTFYEKFKSKWAKVIAERKKTKTETEIK
jgi:hypothetical protein